MKHKACSSKVELFLTEKTKLPVFMKIYPFPGKNGGAEKNATQETHFQQELKQVTGMAIGSHCTKPGEERTVT